MERSRAGILSADGFAGTAPLARFQGLLGLAHFVEAPGDHALDGVVAIGKGVFERPDDFDCVAIGLNPEGDPADAPARSLRGRVRRVQRGQR